MDSGPDRKSGDGGGPGICIIGAGSSGLVTAKVLKQKGLAFDCFEKGSDIGGMLTRRFVGSPRYTPEVDFRSYARDLAQDCRERRAGA